MVAVQQVVLPLAAWALLMALASAAGLALVGGWPWAARARETGVAFAAGLGAAPLLAGLAAVFALWALPGGQAPLQAALAIGVLALGAAAGLASGATRRALVPGRTLVPQGAAALLACSFIAALLLDAATVPLVQNDALEYATVARILADTRDIASYPVLHAQQHPSGFYGPWTHPPLYVALLELGDVLQGTSESTLLLRLVAPWCLAAAALAVAALARWANPARPSDGPLAALLLVSTPMLFLGAASALIDALPVLGFTLVLSAVAALSATPAARWRRALGIGVMLGLALWTHSQAVLFLLLVLPLLLLVPLPEPQGPRRWPVRLATWLPVAALALAVALAVGGAPYLRNISLFGAPVSDNPLVFALPSLDWPAYFRQQRGLASAAELAQYGLLKPWFAVEAYALVFWLALPVLWRRREPLPAMFDESVHLRPLALGLIALYLAGASLAVVLGIDLMVRNERYMLILVPPAALLAAGAQRRPRMRGALVLLIGVQLAVLVLYRLGQLSAERTPPPAGLDSAGAHTAPTASGAPAPERRLERWGPYAAMAYLRRATPPPSTVLSLKPADMFYAGRTMVSYLDPRLLPFYGERAPPAAAAGLRALGVTHVHLPDYWLPPVYNSALGALLADPALAELSFERNGYQIYRLLRPGESDAVPGAACGQTLAFAGWQREREFVLGGRKNLRRIDLGAPEPWAAGEESRSWNPTPLFLRETNTVLRAKVALPPRPRAAAAGSAAAGAPGAAANRSAGEWLLKLQLAGEGYVQVLVQPHGAGAGGVRQLVADRPLAAAAGEVSLQRRLRIDAAATRLELRVEHRADSRLRVLGAWLVAPCAPRPALPAG